MTDPQSIEKEDQQLLTQTLDTSTDMNQIKTNIDDIKKSVTDLKNDMDDLEKNKNTLAKEILDQKQNAIEAKKIEIETKKKETQELIAKIRKERVDLKLETLDEATKKIFDEQKTRDEAVLSQYEKDLQTIKPLEQGWRGKTKEFIGDKWNSLGSAGKRAVGIGGGILAFFGLKKLFSKDEEEEDEDGNKKKKKKKKGFWNHGIGKVLKIVGIGALAALGIKALRDLFKPKDETKLPPENAPHSDFENLSEDVKTKYYDVSFGIDAFTPSSKVTFFDNATDDMNQKGEMLFELDKETGNLSQFNKAATLDYMQDQTQDDFFGMITHQTQGFLYKTLGLFLSRLESFTPWGNTRISDPAKAIDGWIKEGTPGDHEKQLSGFYKEYMNILHYVTNKKDLILDKKAKAEAMGLENLAKDPTESESERMAELRGDSKRCDNQIKDSRISDIPELMKTYAIEVKDVTAETQAIEDKIAADKKKILQIDEHGESAITRAETDFLDGRLDEGARDELSEVCTDLGNDLFGSEETIGFVGAYFHLITDLFAGNTELAENYMKQMGWEDRIDTLRTTLQSYVTKLENNTFTQKDLQDLKNQTEVYFTRKEKFTQDIANIEKSNTGSDLDISRILNTIFIEPFLDIGKAFGLGKTGSWRERIGCGLGGATVGGGTLYIFGTVANGFGSKIPGEILTFAGKSCIKIGTLPITAFKKGVTFALGRSYLTGFGRSEAILNSGFKPVEQERLIKYAFLHGEISERRAYILYEVMGKKTINNLDALADEFKIKSVAHKEVFKKYIGNKNIRELLAKLEKFNYLKRRENVKHTFKDRILRKDMVLDLADGGAFDQLAKIDNSLKTFTPNKSSLITGFLETTKTLKPDMINELLATNTFKDLTLEESKNIGRLLGKHMHRFASLQDFKDFQAFFFRHYSSHRSETFIANSLSQWKELRKLGKNYTKESAYITEKSLKKTFLQRRITAMKDNFKKSAAKLRELIKWKKTPYPQGVNNVANNLDEVAKVPDEDLSLLAESERMGSGSRISSMSKDVSLMKKLAPLFKDDAFLKELGKLKTEKAVNDFLKTKGIDNVPKEFVTKLANATSDKKLIDTMLYVEKYESLGKIGKIFQSPGMKYAGRVLGRVFVGVTLAVGGFLAYETYQEGSRIAKTNKERGELMQAESFVDIGLTLAGAVAFVPGVGWIAAGAIILATTVASIAKEYMFDTLDKYEKNYKDFAYSSSMLIKQHILTTALGSAGEDIGFGDRLLTSGPGMQAVVKQLAAKTGSEATGALLYVEEWKKNPLAMIDIDDTELMAKLANENPPITRAQIADAKDTVDKNVAARYAYLKKKCGMYTTPQGQSFINMQKVVSIDKIKNGEGLKLLDKLMLESEYAIAEPELYGDPKKIEQQQKETKNVLDQDKSRFAALEKLFAKDTASMFYMYRYLNEYSQHLEQFGFDENGKSIEPDYDLIVKNIEYFDAYMKYKTLEQGINVSAYSAGFAEPNFVVVRDFFAGLTLEKPVAEKELYSSSSKLQTILYRIATEVVGVDVSNNMDDIKSVFDESNEQMYGIYFHDNKLDVNGNYFSDTEYTGGDAATIKKIRQDIQEQINATDLIDVGTGDTYLNKEIGNKYLAIIDQELARN